MSSKILTVAFILITCLSSYAQPKELKIQDGALTIPIKETWRMENSLDMPKVIFVQGAENVIITIRSHEGHSLDETFSDYVHETVPSITDNYKYIKHGEKVLNNRAFKVLEFNSTVHNSQLKNYLYMISYQSHFYDFLFSTRLTNAEKYHSIFERFLASIRFELPEIVLDNELKILISKKWRIRSAMISGFPVTNKDDHNHYFTIQEDGKLHFYKKDNSILFESLYSYDPETKTIHYFRRSRPEQLTITNISEKEVQFNIIDGFKDNGTSLYVSFGDTVKR